MEKEGISDPQKCKTSCIPVRDKVRSDERHSVRRRVVGGANYDLTSFKNDSIEKIGDLQTSLVQMSAQTNHKSIIVDLGHICETEHGQDVGSFRKGDNSDVFRVEETIQTSVEEVVGELNSSMDSPNKHP
ncbi:hypothetical protein QYF36_013971 [Acer negundo]|nr:hypothetical protein QYF36_013971 [Acer negundo]